MKHREGTMLSRLSLSLFLSALALAGCATKSPAPVADRAKAGATPPVRAETPAAPAPVVARPGYYIVKPGDTLIRIALDHGQNYRDIAAWSGLENPNLIEVGQELRVKPPESGAVVKPVAPAGADVRPVAPSADGLRREPKGGKVPYSEQAWAQAQKPEAPVVPVKADAKAEPRTDARPDAKPDVKPETKPEAKPETADDKGKDAAKPAAAGDDRIEWSWPAGGKVMAGFNDTSSKGIDLSGKPGDPVYAAAAGKVVYAGTGLRGYGKLLIVKHDNAYLSAYAHNQQLLVKEGQSVSKGQKIAELGDTDSDRPKLHFEIRKQGKPVDPVKYLPSR